MKLKLLLLLTFLIVPTIVSAQEKDLVGYRHKGVIYGATLPNGARI